MTEIENLFSVLGGRFLTPEAIMREKLSQIRAFIFDWDGVFNSGEKSAGSGSSFSEVDSMGVNLLRYTWFLSTGRLPLTAVISGENNPTAFYYCEREKFDYSCYKFPHKKLAIEAICKAENIRPSQIAYVFDDVLDVPVAEIAGLRFLINQRSNPMFLAYCQKNKVADYLTASPGGRFAVREVTELLMALTGKFDAVIHGRKENDPTYQQYIDLKRACNTTFLTAADGIAIEERPAW